jgi:hypothetical protein
LPFKLTISLPGIFLYGMTEGCTIVPINLATRTVISGAYAISDGRHLLIANHTVLPPEDSSLSVVDGGSQARARLLTGYRSHPVLRPRWC